MWGTSHVERGRFTLKGVRFTLRGGVSRWAGRFTLRGDVSRWTGAAPSTPVWRRWTWFRLFAPMIYRRFGHCAWCKESALASYRKCVLQAGPLDLHRVCLDWPHGIPNTFTCLWFARAKRQEWFSEVGSATCALTQLKLFQKTRDAFCMVGITYNWTSQLLRCPIGLFLPCSIIRYIRFVWDKQLFQTNLFHLQEYSCKWTQSERLMRLHSSGQSDYVSCPSQWLQGAPLKWL